jgi:hypothetical protein
MMKVSTFRNVVHVEGRTTDTCPHLLILPIDMDSVRTGCIPGELHHVERVADFRQASEDALLHIRGHVGRLDPIC